MFQMMGVFVEFERAMIQERVRAGLARAKAEGKQLGRPKVDETTENAIRNALRQKNRPGIPRSPKSWALGLRPFNGSLPHLQGNQSAGPQLLQG